MLGNDLVDRRTVTMVMQKEQDTTVMPEQDNCILCGKSTIKNEAGLFDTRYGIDELYHAVYCPSCDLVQTAPLPTSAELKEYYEKYYNFGGERLTLYTRLRHLFLFSFLYRLWLAVDGDISFHRKKGTGLLLDLGCNEGRGLLFYQRNGFQVEGLELNATAAQAARSRGFIVYGQPLQQLEKENAYDVVVLSNVLEHSFDPSEMLRHVHRVLKPGGQAWISCPNSESWLRSVFGRHWINWHVPFHLVHFTQRSLRKLLETTGFSALEVLQETPAVWATHSTLVRLFGRKGRPTRQLRNPLLIIVFMLVWRFLLFPFLWLGNRLGRGDCLVVTARKR